MRDSVSFLHTNACIKEHLVFILAGVLSGLSGHTASQSSFCLRNFTEITTGCINIATRTLQETCPCASVAMNIPQTQYSEVTLDTLHWNTYQASSFSFLILQVPRIPWPVAVCVSGSWGRTFKYVAASSMDRLLFGHFWSPQSCWPVITVSNRQWRKKKHTPGLNSSQHNVLTSSFE